MRLRPIADERERQIYELERIRGAGLSKHITDTKETIRQVKGG